MAESPEQADAVYLLSRCITTLPASIQLLAQEDCGGTYANVYTSIIRLLSSEKDQIRRDALLCLYTLAFYDKEAHRILMLDECEHIRRSAKQHDTRVLGILTLHRQ